MILHTLARPNVKSGICERTISNTSIWFGPVPTESRVRIKERRAHEIARVAGFIPPTNYIVSDGNIKI
jgi:hypothetical protein